MNQLFPEENVMINFSTTDVKSIAGNKVVYHIGWENGYIRRADTDIYLGYSFSSDNGQKYFLSKIKERFPNSSYDAVFYLDVPKGTNIDISVIKFCPKKVLYIEHPITDEIIHSWDNFFL